MKRLIIFSLLWMVMTAMAQPAKRDVLVNKVWMIQADEMSGLGAHTSLPKNTTLQFSPDGSWKSSHPFREDTSGQWRLENNDQTLVMAGKEETRFSIRQLTEKNLQLRLKKNAATFTYTWVRN